MAMVLFTQAILEDHLIDGFNQGKMQRDFIYIDEIVEGVVRALDQPARASESFDGLAPDPVCSNVPYRLFNIDNDQPVDLLAFIEALESALGESASKCFLSLQDGDVPAIWARRSALSPRPRYKMGLVSSSAGPGLLSSGLGALPLPSSRRCAERLGAVKYRHISRH